MILKFWKKQKNDSKENTIDLVEKPNSEIFDFFKDLIVIIVIVVVVRSYVAMPFQISGQSMYSSYYDREFIIVDRVSYLLGEPKRGDVIVFKPYVNDNKKYFLKRIVGVPGDTLKIEDGNIFVKKKDNQEYIKLEEDYLNNENNGYTFVGTNKSTKIYSLGDDQYFVLGDNRNHSTDSRECFSNCIGRTEFISKNDMIGKLFLDLGYFNFKKFGFIQPELGIDTTPRFFSSPSTFNYDF